MLAVRGYYENGGITLLEPLPPEVREADLNIVVLPRDEKSAPAIPADRFGAERKESEAAFKALGMSQFFNTEDDAQVDWEDCFGLK